MLNGSMIIEKVTNNDGTCIKYEDGTMIFYGIKSNNVKQGDNFYTFTFPISFNNNNYISVTSRNNAPSYFTEFKDATAAKTSSNVKIAVFGVSSTPSINLSIGIICIGTWK